MPEHTPRAGAVPAAPQHVQRGSAPAPQKVPAPPKPQKAAPAQKAPASRPGQNPAPRSERRQAPRPEKQRPAQPQAQRAPLPEDPGLPLISRRPPKQKYANFEEYIAAHGGVTAPLPEETADRPDAAQDAQ